MNIGTHIMIGDVMVTVIRVEPLNVVPKNDTEGDKLEALGWEKECNWYRKQEVKENLNNGLRR